MFAIFTSRAWNMTFSFYQSLRTVPRDLQEVARGFHLSPWQRFWKLDAPFAMPGLIWNMMMSMSGGWFFIVASEAITVGNNTFTLPGIGAYLAQAILSRDLPAIGWVLLTMTVVITAYDQLLFRPLVAWADKFRMETTRSASAPTSAVEPDAPHAPDPPAADAAGRAAGQNRAPETEPARPAVAPRQ